MSTVLAPKIPLAQLARQWGWKAAKLYRLCAAQQIPHLRIGGQIFFEPAELGRWLDAQRTREQDEPRAATRPAQQGDRAAECARLGIPVAHEFS